MPGQADSPSSYPDLEEEIREVRNLCEYLEAQGRGEIQRIVDRTVAGYGGRPLLLVLYICARDREWRVEGEEVAGEYSVAGTLLRHLLHLEEEHPACDRCGKSENLYYIGYIYLGPPGPGNAPSKLVVRTAFGRDLQGTVKGGRIIWREFRGTPRMEPYGLHIGEVFPSVGSLRDYLRELEQRKREEDGLKGNPMFG
jgi:hypothetical protein